MTRRYSFAVDREQLQKVQRDAHNQGDLLVWTIYDHPRDLPHAFVARPHSSKHNAPLTCHFESATLADVRRQMRDLGLVRMAAAPSDDPCIVECWL
jgi:hypothetical protein